MADFSRLSFNDENARAGKEAPEDNESDKIGQIWLPQLRRGAAAIPASGNLSGAPNRAASETGTASEWAKWNITPSVAGSDRTPRTQTRTQAPTKGNNSNFAKVPVRASLITFGHSANANLNRVAEFLRDSKLGYIRQFLALPSRISPIPKSAHLPALTVTTTTMKGTLRTGCEAPAATIAD
jgi:hypothetical protein